MGEFALITVKDQAAPLPNILVVGMQWVLFIQNEHSMTSEDFFPIFSRLKGVEMAENLRKYFVLTIYIVNFRRLLSGFPDAQCNDLSLIAVKIGFMI